MIEHPTTQYVRVGNADVAYQVVGDGPIDVVSLSGLAHIDVQWHYPPAVRINNRLASFSRLILFDRRGWGASSTDYEGLSTLEEWAEDVGAVLDAVGSERAAIIASGDGGSTAMLFAALHPERVTALVLSNTTARVPAADDYPIGLQDEVVAMTVGMLEQLWGTADFMRMLFPASAEDEEFVKWAGAIFRASSTPADAGRQFRYMFESVDVRSVLPLIHVPTLVMHNTVNLAVPPTHGQFLADNIAGARFVQLPGVGVTWDPGDEDTVVDHIVEFLTGELPEVPTDRVLATVLFTDIVDSTKLAASLGDGQWLGLLDKHNRLVREQLRRHGGREINTAGDGFVASFDGPGRAIRCAKAIVAGVVPLGVQVRAGIHTGECEVRGTELGGLSIHLAARVGAAASGGEVLVTGTVTDLVVGSGLEFRDRGEHDLKGVPGRWRLFAAD